jgi:predicted glycogen debranching enzyme
MLALDPDAEWLESDGLGGFASATVSGIRTRRYHAVLLAALRPPADRWVLVSGFESWLEGPLGRRALSSQRYLPDVVHPDGARRLVDFRREPWPAWRWDFDGLAVELELVALDGHGAVALAWRAPGAPPGTWLEARPLLAVRELHGLVRKNADFCFDPEVAPGRLTFRPYPERPGVTIAFDGRYRHSPCWYEQFLYREEQARGLDCVEDLASPGSFRLDLGRGETALVVARDGADTERLMEGKTAGALAAEIRDAERRRRAGFATPLERAGAQFVVRRGAGRTIVAGYPWFGDWGRDTFVALRGLCLATGRLDEARAILLEWAEALDAHGRLPNRFPDRGEAPEYNSVDAALWFAVVAGELIDRAPSVLGADDRSRLEHAVACIADGYARGAPHGIRLDPDDGLLLAGEPGVQLTWMDAKLGDWVVTPRIGKPVEVQALWIAALAVAARSESRFAEIERRARASFGARFWNEPRGCLYDVVDAGGQPGRVEAALRPNQIFAIGGLGPSLLGAERTRAALDVVERELWTPVGLRSLAPGEAGYAPRYDGDVRARDSAYHQGTAWPWLIGPFVEAWVRVRGGAAAVKQQARVRFLAPLREHLGLAGLGHVSEIADAEPPHVPRGCPFQAWSLGELLRLEKELCAD